MCIACCTVETCNAQDNIKDFDDFRKEIKRDFNHFRREIVSDFIDFIRNPWQEQLSVPPVPKPKETPIPPVVVLDNDIQNTPQKDTPIVIENVIKTEPIIPQPQPIEPILEIPKVKENFVQINYFGTKCIVRYPYNSNYEVKQITEDAVADALNILSTKEYDNLVYDCLKIRGDLQLCDWAYLLFLKNMSETACGKGTNEATLLMSYVYLLSGYKMRLAHDGHNVYMLFASNHTIFEKPSYNIGGDIYYGVIDLPSKLMISDAKFPQEQNLSLIINKQPLLTIDRSDAKIISSTRYPEFKLHIEINKNLLSFYETYPNSYYNGDFMTQWAQYANAPISLMVAESLYPELKDKVKSLSESEAVNRLLNWVQTGFKYEYDEKVWGHDRTFFSEESLFYPCCDCEDRSILLSRIIRDVLKLKCLLIFYPGHLAVAVNFNEDITGDYISVNGNKYIVCDPTFIGASIGNTMPGMNNKTASVIILE